VRHRSIQFGPCGQIKADEVRALESRRVGVSESTLLAGYSSETHDQRHDT